MRVVPLLLLSACMAVGPRSVPRDRFDYSAAVGNSWKQQMLLNIVKFRYLDPPTFLKVEQILAGYTLEGSGSVGWGQSGNIGQGWLFGGSGRFTDRPTITYRPLSGTEFARNLMTPIAPAHVLYLIQGGYSVDMVMSVCVQAINGLRNRQGARGKQVDDDFLELVMSLKLAYDEGATGMRILSNGQDKDRGQQTNATTTIVTFQPEGVSERGAVAAGRVRELLGLDQDAGEFKVNYGTGPGGPDTITMLTRSPLRIMIELATMIDLPEGHEDRAGDFGDDRSLIHIRSSKRAPDDAFVDVSYRGHHFYLSDTDLLSKRNFAFLNLLFSFVETGSSPLPTLVTVPG